MLLSDLTELIAHNRPPRDRASGTQALRHYRKAGPIVAYSLGQAAAMQERAETDLPGNLGHRQSKQQVHALKVAVDRAPYYQRLRGALQPGEILSVHALMERGHGIGVELDYRDADRFLLNERRSGRAERVAPGVYQVSP